MNPQENGQSDLAVMDANEYKQKRRLQRILDAHDKVEEMVEQAYGDFVDGAISVDGRNIRILRAVQFYIREVHNLLIDWVEDAMQEDREPYYWSGSEQMGPLGRVEFESKPDEVFWGLEDILYARDIYTEEWDVTATTRHGPNQTETRSATHTVPDDVSLRAYLLVNKFLSKEQGMEIQFEEMEDGLPDWGFEEVDEDDVKSNGMEVL